MSVIFTARNETNLAEWGVEVDTTNNLNWAAAAALANSSGGISVYINGAVSTAVRYVGKEGLNDTSGKVRLRFYFDPNTITMTSGDSHNIVQVDATTTIFTVQIRYDATVKYQMRVYRYYAGGGAWTTPRTIPATNDAEHYAEIYMWRSSGDGVGDGGMTWWIGSVQQDTYTTDDNYTEFSKTDDIYAGGVANIDAGTLGTYYLDEFVMNNDGSEIGPAGIIGTSCWGHITGVVESNVRTFANHWTGTGAIEGVGDTEYIELNAGEYMISETVYTGIKTIELDQNHYSAGDTATMKYRTGTTQVECEAAGWTTYTVPFVSANYVQVYLYGFGI